MTDDITQAEADALLALSKRRADEMIRDMPSLGDKLSVPLVSLDGREQFIFDIHQARLVLAKVKYQTRARSSVILARLDLGGAPHCNPDGQEVGVPHLHLYREGYADKWAIDVPLDRFRDITNKLKVMEDFLNYCNVLEHPLLRPTLWS